MLREQILSLFSGRIRNALQQLNEDFKEIQEIRIRINQPVILLKNEKEIYLEEDHERILAEAKEIRMILDAASGYSGYAFEEEIRRGYLTISGGHRIGLVGRAVMNAQGVQTLKYISALNIRIAHPVKGCAGQWRKYLYEGNRPCHILIISPPGCGKTTLLRDIVRIFSDGTEKARGITVGVVDERSEIAGIYRGVPAHELGMRTDILDGCPKSLGMEMMLRSMAPKVLAVDEIASSDVVSIENALRCGCSILATLHGECLKDFLTKPGFASLVKEKVFERYFFLKRGQTPGIVAAIYDKDFRILWEEKECI